VKPNLALALAGGLIIASAVQAQDQPRSGDPANPTAPPASSTLSNGAGNGSTSDDDGVTSLGAEAARERTASGSVALSARDLHGIKACRAMSREAETASSRCKALAAAHPALFNGDGTVRDPPQ
jgi:hypothetical protein